MKSPKTQLLSYVLQPEYFWGTVSNSTPLLLGVYLKQQNEGWYVSHGFVFKRKRNGTEVFLDNCPSDIANRHSLAANALFLCLMQSFCPPSLQWFLSLRCRDCVVDGSIGTGYHNSDLRLIVVFCNGLWLLQREVSWWGLTLIWGKKDEHLECS